MKHHVYSAFAIAALTATALACSNAGPGPGTPSSPTGQGTEANPDGSTLKVTAPTAISPVGGIEVDDDDPDLVINNATPRFVANLPLAYVFEVTNASNQLVYRSAPIPAGGNGRTSHEPTTTFQPEEVHTWRAYAVYQGQRGPMSEAASFKTLNRFGESCSHLGSEIAIVVCRRQQFGFLDHDERVDYLRRIAFDLNRGGFEHRPYGILVKDTGNNCGGYSCDIICSGNGNSQRQWDVLSDEDFAQLPVWNRLGEVAVRPCEFIQ